MPWNDWGKFAPSIDIIHIDPIDVPMNRRITAVIMNGLLAEL
jgi:hypothetical protein